jgi:hypothetical protein
LAPLRKLLLQSSHSTESLSGMLSVTASISNTVRRVFPQVHRELMSALNSDFLDFLELRKAHQDHKSSQDREGWVSSVCLHMFYNADWITRLTEYNMDQFLRMTMFLLSNKLPINAQSGTLDR